MLFQASVAFTSRSKGPKFVNWGHVLNFFLIIIFRRKSKSGVKVKRIKIQRVSDLPKKKKIIKNGEPRLKEKFDRRLKKKELI